jgi:hypothetical protein
MTTKVETTKNEKVVNVMPLYRNRVGVKLEGFGVSKHPGSAMVNAWLLVGIAALGLFFKAI